MLFQHMHWFYFGLCIVQLCKKLVTMGKHLKIIDVGLLPTFPPFILPQPMQACQIRPINYPCFVLQILQDFLLVLLKKVPGMIFCSCRQGIVVRISETSLLQDCQLSEILPGKNQQIVTSCSRVLNSLCSCLPVMAVPKSCLRDTAVDFLLTAFNCHLEQLSMRSIWQMNSCHPNLNSNLNSAA